MIGYRALPAKLPARTACQYPSPVRILGPTAGVQRDEKAPQDIVWQIKLQGQLVLDLQQQVQGLTTSLSS